MIDPAFNLSAEEYLLNIVQEPTFMLWRSHPSVIIGRNQNPYRQVDVDFLDRTKIPVLRRISGGGAVYHDLGNINFTIIHPTGKRLNVDYQTPLQPINRFLRRMGLAARFDGTNSLTVSGKKFSGNAQHIQNGKVLHHGTLLYEANLQTLSNALRTLPEGKYKDRSVDSVRQPVANICSFLSERLSVNEFMHRLIESMQLEKGGRHVQLSSVDKTAIQKLAESKYRTWQWNFGQTPDYWFTNTARLGQAIVKIEMQVRSGTIHQIDFTGRGLNDHFYRELHYLLRDCRHFREDITTALKQLNMPDSMKAVTLASLIEALF